LRPRAAPPMLGRMPPPPSPPPLAQSVTFLYAEDVAASRRFYAEVLGLPLELEQAGGACAIFAAAPGDRAFLGVCRARGPRQVQDPRTPGGVVFTLVSADVDGWHARLVAAGAEVLGPPALSAEYRVYGFFFRDPAGYLLEVQRFEDPGWPAPYG
jgi:catechol 2,3-dioxygenase-like lactoylglutathione lyase family enzyme